jgi:uncharacterized membrane protein YhaH (DUF805 family)
LTEEDADKYLAALQRTGAKVHKEADLAASLSLLATDDHAGPATAATDPASATHMSCPKCGHTQAKALICEACGIVIDKFLARQAELGDSAPAVTSQAAAIAAASVSSPVSATPYAPPATDVAEALPEFAELKLFGIEGRIGRLRYLAWSLAATAIALLAGGIAFGVFTALGLNSDLSLPTIIGALLVIMVSIAMIVFYIQIGVKRLHDMGWSGWLLLLSLLPYAGAAFSIIPDVGEFISAIFSIAGGVFSIIMLVVPGSKAANRFGAPPQPNSLAVKILASLWLLVPVLGILAAIAIPQYQRYTERALEAQSSSYEEVDSAAYPAEAADAPRTDEAEAGAESTTDENP